MTREEALNMKFTIVETTGDDSEIGKVEELDENAKWIINKIFDYFERERICENYKYSEHFGSAYMVYCKIFDHDVIAKHDGCNRFERK